MSQSTRKPPIRKAAWPVGRPKKPYPDFPLTPHVSGKWMKKIRGRIHYFGAWARRVNGKLERVESDGWKEALELYKAQANDLHAGRTPRAKGDDLTVKALGDTFLTAKHRKLQAKELGLRMFEEYRHTAQLLADTFGKERLVDDLAADDFEKLRANMAERWGPVRLGNAITRVKSVFKYGIDNGLIEKAIRYGSEFRKPGKAVLRRHRAENGERMIEADECRKMIDAAAAPLKAMVLLGLNCGFGNADCSSLPLAALDLDGGWINYPRPKTGINRRCPLWSETVTALREAIAARPEAQEEATGLVFVTDRGTAWVRATEKSRTDNVSGHFAELMKGLKTHRDGIGFYTLRHVFRTVADAARDPVATDLIMGHADPSMGGHYRERIDDSRLRAVAEHVRSWLWPKPAKAPKATPQKPTRQPRPKVNPEAKLGDARATLRLYSPETKGGAA